MCGIIMFFMMYVIPLCQEEKMWNNNGTRYSGVRVTPPARSDLPKGNRGMCPGASTTQHVTRASTTQHMTRGFHHPRAHPG